MYSESEMKSYNFTIVASGLEQGAQDYSDRFFEAGCDDATIALQKGRFVLEFDRDADSFEDAALSAILDVRQAGASVERVEPDHLVNASDIAERMGVTRAAVSLYAQGKRGGGFPAPVARVTTDSPLWDWSDVAKWLMGEGKISEEAFLEALAIRRINEAIAHDQRSASNDDHPIELKRA
jgi:transcriptional regulator with XRE-family HTH domain